MENQRIRVSKTMLEGALMRLLREKRVDKVTVYELCQEAGINRTTFYKYYGSPQDLLDQIIAEMLAQFEQAHPPQRNPPCAGLPGIGAGAVPHRHRQCARGGTAG